MKTQKMTLALAVFAGLTFGSVYAQSEDQVLNSEQIDVDGYLKEQNVTDGELEQIKGELGKQKNMTQLNKEKAKELGKLSGQTEKLLDSQDQYIDEKIESQKAIKEFNKKTAENELKLRCLLEESKSPECSKWVKNKEPVVEDSISTGQASVAKIEAVAPAAPVTTMKAFEEIKLIPFAGVTNFQGETERHETSFAGGLRLESNINERLSMGVGVNYGRFETQDFANNNNFNQPWSGGYFAAFGNGRQIDYQSLGLDFYAKFFLTRGERFRPYLGAGLGYNRMTLVYRDQGQNFFNPGFGQTFGNEELTNTFANGLLMGGTELRISRSIGMNIELQYSRGFGAGDANTGVNPFNAPDQRRLQTLSDEIINSNAISIFAGMVVTF
jgi:opacity protein-like surface antigen